MSSDLLAVHPVRSCGEAVLEYREDREGDEGEAPGLALGVPLHLALLGGPPGQGAGEGAGVMAGVGAIEGE